ncbi:MULTISPECIES: hypothetical protein [unclassified Curtobacterium]|uniref:hypothetical protein n=1 Tax=unclassified Curtobacterium TaxID=257496 RepID=UPI001113FA47|nr:MULTISPECIES: hypothetical protein [unclassified Curtobacterium]
MTTPGPGTPSPPAAVHDALLALHRSTEHPFDVSVDAEGRYVATYVLQADSQRTTYRYVVRLLPETAEYTRIMKSTSVTSVVPGATSWRFSTGYITRPVNETLAAHGWRPRRTAFGKLLRRVLGRPA